MTNAFDTFFRDEWGLAEEEIYQIPAFSEMEGDEAAQFITDLIMRLPDPNESNAWQDSLSDIDAQLRSCASEEFIYRFFFGPEGAGMYSYLLDADTYDEDVAFTFVMLAFSIGLIINRAIKTNAKVTGDAFADFLSSPGSACIQAVDCSLVHPVVNAYFQQYPKPSDSLDAASDDQALAAYCASQVLLSQLLPGYSSLFKPDVMVADAGALLFSITAYAMAVSDYVNAQLNDESNGAIYL